MEFYEALKKEIASRLEDRDRECRDTEADVKLRRAQGAAQELESLIHFIDCMENPPKVEDKE